MVVNKDSGNTKKNLFFVCLKNVCLGDSFNKLNVSNNLNKIWLIIEIKLLDYQLSIKHSPKVIKITNKEID